MSKFYVIFDMDGTLLNTQRVHIPAWDLAGENQGLAHVGAHIPAVCGMNEQGWGQYLLDHYDGLDLPRFKAEAEEYVRTHYTVEFMAGAKELLEWLYAKGIPMAVASGSDEDLVRSNMEKMNATHYFQGFLGGEAVENGKPAPDIFLQAAKALGAEPESCIVFEDSANGIRAAVAAGMRCFGCPDLAEFSAEVKGLLYKELTRLDEAIPYLEEI